MSPSFFRDTFPNTDRDARSCIGKGAVLLTLLLGLAVRVIAALNTHIINPDGIYYIHQARAIYFGEWEGLTSCHLSFVSIYPFLISGAYALLRDWVAAAYWISVLFGSATLIPLYLLCRRFLDRDASILTLLLFAVLPVFVSGSAEIIRDPVCWFFLALGIYLFVSSYEEEGRRWLLLSCLFFMLASWARIESALFLMVGLVHLLTVPPQGRRGKAIWFALPILGAASLIVLAASFLDQSLTRILRLHDIVEKLSAPLVAYQTLRGELAELMRQPLEGVMPYFLHRTRQVVWLVGLGTVVKYMIRAYFYLFFVLFLVGLGPTWRRSREEPGILYLQVSTASVFVVYYLHVIQTWMMFDRFWGIFMVPAVIVVGLGLRKTILVMTTRYRFGKPAALAVLGLVMLVFTLPKDLKPTESDKRVYREIGERIALMEGNEREIRILKSPRTPDWTAFYANLNYKGAPCPRVDFSIEDARVEATVFNHYEGFMDYLTTNHADYFLWEEKAWPRGVFDLLVQKRADDLLEAGAWYHPDVGRIILFRVHPGRAQGVEVLNRGLEADLPYGCRSFSLSPSA